MSSVASILITFAGAIRDVDTWPKVVAFALLLAACGAFAWARR